MARILIIDDDKQIRLGLRWILEREGHEVLDACNGQKGIEIFKDDPVDLVITDIVMPEKEGIETIKQLKERCVDIKIIAISGGGSVDPRIYLYLAGKLGANGTLMKPFSREELLIAVKGILQ